MAAKKHHPEDLAFARYIAEAKEFSAFLRTGPHEKFKLDGFGSYEEARAAADGLEREHSRFGRRAIVYAITRQGYSIDCSPKLVALAREIEA